jgi:serine/threonine protein kinase
VSNIAHESENDGYPKFVQGRRKEIKILPHLTGIKSPANHTIAGVRIWPVLGGTVKSMPVAGGWLMGIEKPEAHLWSVAKQLFEAVDFMHRHGVAHMDLKPQNILTPRNGGHLSTIDFNTSLRVKGIEQRFRGIVGTTGYTAPEVVRDGLYSAIRTDLWSCGKKY